MEQPEYRNEETRMSGDGETQKRRVIAATAAPPR